MSDQRPIGSFANQVKRINETCISRADVYSVTKYDGFVRSLDYFKKQVFSRDLSSYKIVKRGEFAYSTIHLDEGALGLLGDEEALISPMYTTFEVDESVDKIYLSYLLRSPELVSQYGLIGQGSVNRRKSVPFSSLAEIEVFNPPLPEQKKIASVLTHLDGIIETTQKQINKLHDLKKATTNELLAKGIDHKEFKESELGRIPNDWESVALGEFCREIVVGHVGSTSEHYIEKDGVRFIRTGDLKDGKIRLTETKQITREFHRKLKKSSLKSGDVLVSRVGDTGQAALVPEDLGEANCANIIIIRCGEKLLPQFLRIFINSEFFFDQVARVSIGSAQAVLNVAIIKQLLLSLPSVEEQRGICSMVHELENLIGNLKGKLAQTQTLKKSLMQDLLSGRKRVSV